MPTSRCAASREDAGSFEGGGRADQDVEDSPITHVDGCGRPLTLRPIEEVRKAPGLSSNQMGQAEDRPCV